jgi:hypothetical protein
MCGWERLEYDQDRKLRGLGAQTTGNLAHFVNYILSSSTWASFLNEFYLKYSRSMHVGFTTKICTSKSGATLIVLEYPFVRDYLVLES